jgi:hypothetical protein
MAVTINIPSQVKTYANLAAFPASGSLKTIFIAEDTNKTYRWTGSVYVEISGADFSGYVPTSRTLTINGTTQDLSANRTFTIPTDLTIGTTPIASGTIGRVLFQGTGNVLQQSSSLFWDGTNNRLGIGTSSPSFPLDVVGSNLVGIRSQIDVNNVFDAIQLRNTFAGTSNQIRIKFDNENTVTPSSGGVIFYTGNAYSFYPQNSFGFWNHTSNGIIALATNNTERLRLFSTGNLGINTTTDAGFKLDVNGTARVQGNTTVALNQNAITSLNVSNTTNGTASQSRINLTSNNGSFILGKNSTTTNTYKTLLSDDAIVYNTSSDISILNDFASGRIKFATGGVSTPQMTIFSTGNIGINTTTDAGFRLDVNGTARVSGNLLVNNTTDFGYRMDVNGNVRLSGNQNTLTGSVLIGTTYSFAASAVLKIDSTTQGFLPPRMTTAQKNAIVSPVAGLVVYDTTLNLLQFYNGTIWI